MEVVGKIKSIGQTAEVGSSNFKKRDIVVTTQEQYPQHILIQFVQDKCDILDNYKVGQSVTVGVNLRGREWTDPQGLIKYFNTIQGWKINAEEVVEEAQEVEILETDINEEEQDDLPFN